MKKDRAFLADIRLRTQLNSIVLLVGVSVAVMLAAFVIGYQHLALSRARSYFEDVSAQLELRITSTVKSIRDTSKKTARSVAVRNFLISRSPQERAECYAYMSNQLRNEIEFNNYTGGNKHFIHNINIIDLKNNRSQFYIWDVNDIYEQISKDYGITGKAGPEAPYFTTPYYSDSLEQYYFGYVEPITANISLFSSGPRLGTSVYICSVDVFQDIVEAVSESYHPIFTLSDKDHAIFASSDKDSIGRRLEDLNIHLESFSSTDLLLLNGQKYLAKALPIDETGWTLTYFVPYDELVKGLMPFLYGACVAGAASVALILLVCAGIVGNVNRQLATIIAGCQKMAVRRSARYRLPEAGKNEIGELVVHFNRMLEEIEGMTRKIVSTQDQLFTAELEKRQASLEALQSQINPHFLYNTLECIRNIASVYGAEEIEQIVVSMADIFRYSIRREERVTVKDELGCIRSYFEIMKVRHSERFRLEMDVDPALLDVPLPRMVLQPLVENAVGHGLEKRTGPGTVTIFGRRLAEDCVIEIRDNGVGIGPNQLSGLRRELENPPESGHTSIGIFNIQHRLRFLYGGAYGLSMEAEAGKGTCVRIRIPFRAPRADGSSLPSGFPTKPPCLDLAQK